MFSFVLVARLSIVCFVSEDLAGQLSQLEAERAGLAREAQSLEQQLQDALDCSARQEKELAAELQEKQQLEERLRGREQLGAEQQALEASLEQLRAELLASSAELEAERSRGAQQLQALQQNINGLNDSHSTLVEQLQDASAALQVANNNKAQLEQQLQDALDRSARQEKELAAELQEKQQLEERLRGREQLGAEQQALAASLEQLRAELEVEKSRGIEQALALQQTIDEVGSSRGALVEQLAQATAERDVAQRQLQVQQEELQDLLSARQQSTQRDAAEAAKAAEEASDQALQEQQLLLRVEKAEAHAHGLVEQAQLLTRRNADLSRQLDEAREQLEIQTSTAAVASESSKELELSAKVRETVGLLLVK